MPCSQYGVSSWRKQLDSCTCPWEENPVRAVEEERQSRHFIKVMRENEIQHIVGNKKMDWPWILIFPATWLEDEIAIRWITLTYDSEIQLFLLLLHRRYVLFLAGDCLDCGVLSSVWHFCNTDYNVAQWAMHKFQFWWCQLLQFGFYCLCA